MARKKKNQLPSGNVRVQVYTHTDANGKKHYKSFTAATKALAQAMADEWRLNQSDKAAEKLTVHETVERYIALKSGVLSPSTITGYKAYATSLKDYKIANLSLEDVRAIDVQEFVTDISVKRSPKTVRNMYGLLSSSIALFRPELSMRITLPQKVKPDLYTPSTKDVQILLDNCHTTEEKLAILFAAVGTMRRGEASAVTFSDVDFTQNTISVNKSMVKVDGHSEWEIKAPKTHDSYRTIKMPKYIIDMIASLDRKTGTVLGMDPDQIYKRFYYARRRSGLPSFRYHDLRHYAASSMHAQGVPERYIEAIGGWSSGSNVLKRVYENVLDTELVKIEKKLSRKKGFSV